MNSVERMRELLSSLPKSDQNLGEQFLQNRDFESLKELTDSAIYIVKKHKSRKNEEGGVPPKQEYLDVDLAELSRLKSEVDVYLTQLEVPYDSYID